MGCVGAVFEVVKLYIVLKSDWFLFLKRTEYITLCIFLKQWLVIVIAYIMNDIATKKMQLFFLIPQILTNQLWIFSVGLFLYPAILSSCGMFSSISFHNFRIFYYVSNTRVSIEILKIFEDLCRKFMLFCQHKTLLKVVCEIWHRHYCWDIKG